MRWSYYSRLFHHAVWGGDFLGSNRIETKMPDSDTVHSLELWAMQYDDDPDFWDVVAVRGSYDFNEGSSYGGVSVFCRKSDFLAEEISFDRMIELLENVHMHVRNPDTGFRLNAPSGYTGKSGTYDDDGIAYRRVRGVQRHYSHHEGFAEIKARRMRLHDAGLG